MAENPSRQADDADWLTGMFDLQADLAKQAIAENNRLRRRVRELEQQLCSGTASTLMELQDCITTLELQLAKSRSPV